MLSVDCKFEEWPWIDENRYTCNVNRKTIPENQPAILNGRHLIPHTNFDVTGINFNSCRVTKIPRNLMLKSFSLLRALAISNCGLREIKCEDLVGLNDLRVLWLNDNELEFLPGDLFSNTIKLEFISLEKNKIKYIEADFLNPLVNLKSINFFGNINIDKVFNKTFLNQGVGSSLDEVRNDILVNCKPPVNENHEKIQENQELRVNNNQKLAEIQNLSEKIDELSILNASLNDEVNRLNNQVKKLNFFNEIREILADDDFKDFTILTRGEKFKIHKFLAAARSPTIRKAIKNRPDIDSLTFTDIPVNAFREILKYFYENQLPSDESNFRDIFITANKLEIDEIKNFVVEKIIQSLCDENAVEILALANKHDHEELRMKSFEEIQKIFPDRELKAEVALDVNKIKKLIEAKKKFDEEFENV